MTITELIPTVKGLSHTDKLLLLQVLVQELLQKEGVTASMSSFLHQPESLVTEGSITLEERRHFLEQPLAERRRILAEQADMIYDHYQQDSEWQNLMAGDIVDY